MFRNILLAADGSKHSKRATEKAVYMAQRTDKAVITLLHVVDDLPARSEVLDFSVQPRFEIQETEKSRIYEIEEMLRKEGVNFSVKHIYGDPGPAIVREANTGSYDIVVIGSRGLNTFQQFVLGSVSHKVAKRVRCPVLIVK